MMSGYIIKRAILVTLDTYNSFIHDVHKIPFLGKDKRQSVAFYQEIQVFLQHLICNNYLYAKSTPDDDPYTQFSPISSKLGKAMLKFVFEQSKYLCCDRALELIEKTGIIKRISHDYTKKKSRQFALSKAYLRRWFGDTNHAGYMQRDDRLIYLTTTRRRRNIDSLSEKSLVQQALTTQIRVKHKTRHASRETVKYMKEVYRAMGGLLVNLDKLRDYVPTNDREALAKTHFLGYLKARGCKLVSSVPLVVEFWPEYKLAKLGSRSFEQHGGFQAMKSQLKWAIFEGYNYDIKSSQLTILRHELKRYGIKCPLLKKISKKKVMRLFKVSEKVAKLLIYSLIYSLGDVKKNKESKVFRELCHIDGYERAVEIADEWREFTTPIKKKLKQLVGIYIGQGVNCPGRGQAIRNAVRQTYMINPKKQKITAKNLRQILSHMIQGIESKAVYETILNNPGVCGSIEHDGLVSTKPLDWAHPYLRLKLKHEQ